MSQNDSGRYILRLMSGVFLLILILTILPPSSVNAVRGATRRVSREAIMGESRQSWDTPNRSDVQHIASRSAAEIQTRYVDVVRSPNYFSKQNASETIVGKSSSTDWLTYENRIIGYRIQFPKDWRLRESLSMGYPYLKLLDPNGYWLNTKGQVVSSGTYTGTIGLGQAQGSFLNVTAMEGALTIFSTSPDVLPMMKVFPSHFI